MTNRRRISLVALAAVILIGLACGIASPAENHGHAYDSLRLGMSLSEVDGVFMISAVAYWRIPLTPEPAAEVATGGPLSEDTGASQSHSVHVWGNNDRTITLVFDNGVLRKKACVERPAYEKWIDNVRRRLNI